MHSAIMVGPILAPDAKLQRTSLHDVIRRDIIEFNATVNAAWGSAAKKTALPAALSDFTQLYSDEYLLRMCFSRQSGSLTDVRSRVLRIQEIFNVLLPQIEELSWSLPPHQITKLVAAASTLVKESSIRAGRLFGGTQAEYAVLKGWGRKNDLTRANVTFRVACRPKGLTSGLRVSLAHQSTSDDGHDPVVAEQREQIADAGFTAWQANLYESFVLMRNWMNTKFGSLPLQLQRNTDGGLGQSQIARLARFAGTIFLANEATVYAANYLYSPIRLDRYGAFSDDKAPADKLDAMYDHMRTIGLDMGLRPNSISYRAFDLNKTQYCRAFDASTHTAVPVDQPLTFPMGTRWTRWGASACAVPIRVHGRAWGVIEVISHRPHNFPMPVRAKVEEFASILSPFLFYHSALRGLQQLAEAQNELGNRLTTLADLLPNLLMCKSIALAIFNPADGRRANEITCLHRHRPSLAEKVIDSKLERGPQWNLYHGLRDGPADVVYMKRPGQQVAVDTDWPQDSAVSDVPGIASTTYIKLRDAQLDGRVIGIIDLYHDPAIVIDPHWQPFYRLIADHIVAALRFVRNTGDCGQ